MDSYRYLIVGGGMAADAVCKGIRSVDETGTIGVIGAEPHPPYKRPPLTKASGRATTKRRSGGRRPRRARSST
jgi:NAD(P)H-nitrite reductase large subunit